MASVIEIDFGDALVRGAAQGRLQRVRHQDAEIEIEQGDEVGVVLNLSRRHRVDGVLCGLRHSDTPEIGSVTVIPPGTRFRGSVTGSCSVIMLSLPWSALARAAEASGNDPSRLDVQPRLNRLDSELARTVYAVTVATGPDQDEALDLVAAELAVGQPTSSRDPARGGLAPAKLRRVVDRIEAELSGPVSLAGLAAEAAMSPFHFARAFARVTGLAPHQFLLRRRLDRAVELLEQQPDLAVGTVAVATGFTHASHLARALRRRATTSPSVYRTHVLP